MLRVILLYVVYDEIDNKLVHPKVSVVTVILKPYTLVENPYTTMSSGQLTSQSQMGYTDYNEEYYFQHLSSNPWITNMTIFGIHWMYHEP